MFDSVGARSIQMLKPLGLIVAIQLLNVAGIFGNIYKWFAFNADNFYKSFYNAITGMNFTWTFLKGQTMPVQMGYTNSEYRYKVEWFFNERTQKWIHRDAEYRSSPNYFPFVMTTLTTPESEYDLTEYFNGQTYYYGNGRRTMPLPAQLLNMWCMQTHKWFTANELRESYFTIMGTDCNTYTIPVILKTADGVRIYSELFGMRIPESDEESSETGSEEGEEEAKGSEEEGSEEDDNESGEGEEEAEESNQEDEEATQDDEETTEGSNQEDEEATQEDEEATQEDEEATEGSNQEDEEATQEDEEAKESNKDNDKVVENNREDTPPTQQLEGVAKLVEEVPDMEQVD